MTMHAKAALKKAEAAVRGARVGAEGLSDGQAKVLKQAEEHLAKASKEVRFRNATATHAESRLRERLARLREKLDGHAKARRTELDEMHEELRSLRQRLAGTDQAEQVEEIERLLEELEGRASSAAASHDELKAELERLREAVRRMEGAQDKQEAQAMKEMKPEQGPEPAPESEHKQAELAKGGISRWGRQHRHDESGHKDDSAGEASKDTPAEEDGEDSKGEAGQVPAGLRKEGGQHGPEAQDEELAVPGSGDDEGVPASSAEDAAGSSGGGPLDIDTNMPYGDLEPFGREDTAQELTEASLRESNAMVDQLERAEVAEEKRALFRALTRLRGAAITSFDGVARSQTGELDAFNKAFQWRNKHPLRHLADEEGDVSKWAFPDADF